jgi:two-component system NtrC family response regulator
MPNGSKVAAALAPRGTPVIDAGLLRFAAGDDVPPAERSERGDAVASLDEAVATLETRLLRDALAAANGNQSEAARRLGISRVGLSLPRD